MKTTSIAFFLLLAGRCLCLQAQSMDSLIIRRMFSEVLTQGQAYSNLDHLVNKIGGRLSGSPQAEKAVEWAQEAMKRAGADTVYLQEVMVPHWVRGKKEYAKIIAGAKEREVPICALGGSVGTGANGITAQVIEVKNFEELVKLGRKGVEGKIVFFNRPMEPTHIHTGQAYGGAVNQRTSGAIEAARYGAAGVVVRSMTLALDDQPHTGAVRYADTVQRIPACAISTKAANELSEQLKSAPGLKFHFSMHCETLPDVKSYNVIGELRGTEKKDEIVLAGGHLDSWDNGPGAHDDGAGCVQSMEVIRLFKSLGIKPRRTIRAVLFMNEENGLRGGRKYAELAKLKGEKHIAAIESDNGAFTPRGFGIESSKDKILAIQKWKPLLQPYGLHDIGEGHSGADIGPLRDQQVTLIGFRPDSQRYFDYHHTAIDTFDKVNKRELELGAASIAALVYLLSQYDL